VRHAAELVGLITAGLLTGGTLFGALVEHPARVEAGLPAAVAVLGPSMRRGAALELVGAALSFVACVSAAALGGSVLWLIAGILIGVVVPIIFVWVLPISRRLARAREIDASEVERLLDRFGRLHEGRAALGFAGFAVAAVAALG
jgi:hypothetical protein